MDEQPIPDPMDPAFDALVERGVAAIPLITKIRLVNRARRANHLPLLDEPDDADE